MSFIPKRYQECSRENWVGTWPLDKPWRGAPWALVFTGPTGTGKTHAATAVYKEMLGNGFGWWFNVSQAIDCIRDEFRVGKGSQTKRHMMDPRLVLFDDLGTGNSTEFSLSLLSSVICHRYNEEYPTIVTTNARGLEDFEAIDPRIASRLGEGIVLKLEGKDWRIS